MEVNRRTTVYLKEKYLQALPAAGISNVSKFFNHILELVLVLDRPDFSELKQAQAIAESVRSELNQQQKLVEQTEENKYTFHKKASQLFTQDIRYYQSCLPEFDIHGDRWEIWDKSASQLTNLCGFPVTVPQCLSYVRKVAEVS